MHTLPAPPFKGMGKLIHIAAWAILFGLPFFFTGRESQTVTVLSYVRSMIVPLSFMLVFYANYFVLIDHFLFAKRPWKFLLCNVVLIAASMGAVHLMFELLPHPEWEHPRPEREWQETVGFFMVNALDYLLKPISYPDFLKAANKALQWYEHMQAPAAEIESIFIKTEYKQVQVELRKILYIEGLKDYVKIFIEDEPHPILSLMSMKSLEEMLPASRFIRVHRSFIVQPEKIKVIERNRIVFGKEYIPISDNYKPRLVEFLAQRSLNFN